jgi:hypothetical protein
MPLKIMTTLRRVDGNRSSASVHVMCDGSAIPASLTMMDSSSISSREGRTSMVGSLVT